MDARVFIVCEPLHRIEGQLLPKFNLTTAAAWGRVEVLLPHHQSALVTVPTVRMLNDKLEDFSDNDYILPVGDPVLCSTVAMVAARKNHGRVKMLKWDRVAKQYIPIQIDTSGRAV